MNAAGLPRSHSVFLLILSGTLLLQRGNNFFEGLDRLLHVLFGMDHGGVELLAALQDSSFKQTPIEEAHHQSIGGQGIPVDEHRLAGEVDVEDGVFAS